MMPVLFILLIVLMIRGLTMEGSEEGWIFCGILTGVKLVQAQFC
jgi:SNF family Na+-dependent transporter